MYTFSLVFSVNDWRRKWNLSGQFADATFEDIIRDMADIQPHVRLKAIATVAKAAEYKPPEEAGINLGSDRDSVNPVSVSFQFIILTMKQDCSAAGVTVFYSIHNF